MQGFSAEALAARVRDAGARVIVTADESVSEIIACFWSDHLTRALP